MVKTGDKNYRINNSIKKCDNEFSKINLKGRQRVVSSKFTWLQFSNSFPAINQPRPQGAFPWLWPYLPSKGKAPWGQPWGRGWPLTGSKTSVLPWGFKVLRLSSILTIDMTYYDISDCYEARFGYGIYGGHSNFRSLLLQLSNSLTRKELQELKFLCRDVLSRFELQTINHGFELFEALENVNKLSVRYRDFLAFKLIAVNRTDLRNKLLGREG